MGSAEDKGVKEQADNLRKKAADWSHDRERDPNSSIPDRLRRDADEDRREQRAGTGSSPPSSQRPPVEASSVQ